MYYSPLTSDYLYSIETQYLRTSPKTDPLAAKRAADNVHNLGQRGGNANGFASDSLGNVYMLMPSSNAIYIYKYVPRSPCSLISDVSSLSTNQAPHPSNPPHTSATPALSGPIAPTPASMATCTIPSTSCPTNPTGMRASTAVCIRV